MWSKGYVDIEGLNRYLRWSDTPIGAGAMSLTTPVHRPTVEDDNEPIGRHQEEA